MDVYSTRLTFDRTEFASTLLVLDLDTKLLAPTFLVLALEPFKMAQTRSFGNLFSKLLYPQDFIDNSNISIAKVDRRLIERCFKHLSRILKYGSDPRLNLKNSPPCLTDIIPSISDLLQQYINNQSGSLFVDNEHVTTYINAFCINLIDKLKLFAQLLREPLNQIIDEKSPLRKAVTMFTLRLSHILSEFKALFPNGYFIGDSFRITKSDAADFWQSNFGQRIIIPWNEFCQEFSKVHPLKSQLEIAAFKTTVDLTRDNYVSIFEFDIFVRLFHPWKSILKNWNLLAISHPGYVAFLTYDEVKERLSKFIDKPGSYVFRQSCTRPGQWAIGYVTKEKKILQTIPQSRSLIQALYEGQRDNYYKYPDGLNVRTDISAAFEDSSCEQIEISQEQYEIYCQIGDMFEICKICSEREKDTCIEPCNHLICAECLVGWLNKNSKTCPFCREEIKGQHKVKIETFKNDTHRNSQESLDSIRTIDDTNELHSQFPSIKVKLAMQLANNDKHLAIQILRLCESYSSDHHSED
ncbi:hypothetical protein GJ496_001678 [Pomphorhynchus laevis]|nr:hypothetical protein GJ496_001678 [Pomphorhynchus laevis]